VGIDVAHLDALVLGVKFDATQRGLIRRPRTRSSAPACPRS